MGNEHRFGWNNLVGITGTVIGMEMVGMVTNYGKLQQ
jgi:hypothetical protein